jgi:hypothetical protein
LKDIVTSGSEEAEKMLANLEETISDSLTKAVEQYIGTAVDQIIVLCEETKIMIRDGAILSEDERVEYIEKSLVEWLRKDAGNKDSIMYKAKDKAVEYLINRGHIANILNELKKVEDAGISAVEEKIDVLSASVEEIQNTVLGTFDNYIRDLTDILTDEIVENEEEIKSYIEKASESAKDALHRGSEALKDTVNESINGLLGSTGAGDKSFINTNVTASLYSFQYSDYLQIFLLIALMVNQEGVLLRTADVIQTNTGLVKNGESQLSDLDSATPTGYQLQNAYTFVEIEATIEVKPLFMKLPFVESMSTEEIKNNKNWYTIKYRGVQGY